MNQCFTCQKCGCGWERKPTRGRVPRFCPPCREALRRAAHAGLPCLHCGKIGRRAGGSYCSRVCVQAARPRAPKLPPAPRKVKPAPPPRMKHSKECERCGNSFQTWQLGARMCSRRCQRKHGKLARRTREAGSYGEWRWSDFMRIARKFNYCCAYCGQKPARLDPDHVVPLSKGGPNTISNLLPACVACNADKQAYSLSEWAEQRLRRKLPAVVTEWPSTDSRYWHLTHIRRHQSAA